MSELIEPTITPSKFTPFTTAVTDAHVAAIQAADIYLSAKGHFDFSWLTKTGKITINVPIFIEANVYLNAGFFNIGAHSYSKSALNQTAIVKRYCSIGPGVFVMPVNHPMDRLSTCGFDYGELDFHPAGFAKVRPDHGPRKLVIGNDVWIGEGALLGRNIKVGDGAVIGARAIVTKDVPPYAIMAGTPATVRRYRFDEATIDRLLKSEWWDVDPACLTALDTVNVPAFLDGYERLRAEGKLRPHRPRVTAIHDLFRPPGADVAA